METKSSPDYADQDFIKSHSLKCRLLIQHVEDHLFLLIIDSDDTVRYLERVTLQDFLKEDYFFDNLKFEETWLLTIPDSFAFMPFEMMDGRSEHNYDALLLSEEKDHIFQEKMPHTEINNRFTVRPSAYELQKKLGHARFIPSSNILVKRIDEQAAPDQKTLGIQVYPQEFELVYFEGNKFVFYNRFPMANADDFNYFILAVLEQFEIGTGEASVYLSGDISAQDGLYSRVQKYSRDIKFMPMEQHIKFPEELKIDEPHRLALLWGLATCELSEEH